MIKCTLNNLPICYLSLLTIPVSIANKLEAIQCTFLWGDLEDKRKYCLVAWSDVIKPVECGGLGIRSLVELNKTLQGKWLCRFLLEKDALWRRAIAAKFGTNRMGWFTGGAMRSHGRSMWKNIDGQKGNFQNCIVWKAGKGNEIRFWLDPWLEWGLLCKQFPQIFSIVPDKEVRIKE